MRALIALVRLCQAVFGNVPELDTGGCDEHVAQADARRDHYGLLANRAKRLKLAQARRALDQPPPAPHPSQPESVEAFWLRATRSRARHPSVPALSRRAHGDHRRAPFTACARAARATVRMKSYHRCCSCSPASSSRYAALCRAPHTCVDPPSSLSHSQFVDMKPLYTRGNANARLHSSAAKASEQPGTLVPSLQIPKHRALNPAL